MPREFATDGETKADPLLTVGGPVAVHLYKRLENVLELIGRNTAPGVRYTHRHDAGGRVGAAREPYLPPHRGEFHGVREQVEQNLSKLFRVCPHSVRLLGRIGGAAVMIERDLLGGELRCDKGFQLGHQAREFQVDEAVFQLTGVDACEVQDVVDKREQMLIRQAHTLQILTLRIADRPPHAERQQVGVATNGMQRRAQFVRHRGKEVCFGRVRRLCLGAHTFRLVPGVLSLAEEAGVVHRERRALRDLEREVSVRAVRLDPRAPYSHLALSVVYLRLERVAEARKAAARERALVPTGLSAIIAQVETELAAGDLSAARRVIADGKRDVPRDKLLAEFGWSSDFGWALDDADQLALLSLEPTAFDKDPTQRHFVRAQMLRWRGDSAQAHASADSALRLLRAQQRRAPGDSFLALLQAMMLAHAGRSAASRAAFERALALVNARRDMQMSLEVANVYYVGAQNAILLGDHNWALELLAEARRRRCTATPARIRIDPSFAALRSDPRFEAVLAAPSGVSAQR